MKRRGTHLIVCENGSQNRNHLAATSVGGLDLLERTRGGKGTDGRMEGYGWENGGGGGVGGESAMGWCGSRVGRGSGVRRRSGVRRSVGPTHATTWWAGFVEFAKELGDPVDVGQDEVVAEADEGELANVDPPFALERAAFSFSFSPCTAN